MEDSIEKEDEQLSISSEKNSDQNDEQLDTGWPAYAGTGNPGPEMRAFMKKIIAKRKPWTDSYFPPKINSLIDP